MPKSRHLHLPLSLLLLISVSLDGPASPPQKRGVSPGRQPAAVKPQPAATPAPDAGAAAAGKPRLVLQLGPPAFVSGFSFVGFSPDNRLAATSGAGGDVVIWDVATGREVRRLRGLVCDEGWQDSSLAWGAFSPDGRRFAAATCSMLRLWDVATGKRLRVMSHGDNAFWQYPRALEKPPVAFSADGRRVVVRGASELTWDAATGRLVGRVPFRKKAEGEEVVTDWPERVPSPDGTLWLFKEGDGWAVTQRATGRLVRRVPRLREAAGGAGPGAALVAHALSSDGRLMLTVEQVGGDEEAGTPGRQFFTIRDTETGAAARRLEGLSGLDADYRFTPGGELVDVTLDGPSVFVREMLGGHQVKWELEGGHTARDVSPDRRLLVSARGPAGKVWELKTGKLLAHVEADAAAGKVFDRKTGAEIAAFAATPPKKGEGPAPFAWDVVGFTPDKTVTFHKAAGSGVGQDLNVVVRIDAWQERWSRGPDDLVSVMDPTSTERNYVMTPDTLGAAWETDGGESARPTKLLTVWNADPDFEQVTFRIDRDEAYGDPSAFALSPDGRRVLVATSNNGGTVPQAWVKVWDAKTKRPAFQLHSPGFRVRSVAWSPDGRTLATSAVEESGEERAVLWDAATGKALRRLAGGGSVRDGFSPDGRRLLASGAGGFTVVYDVATGAEICRFVVRADGSWVVVDPEGRFDTDDLDEVRGVHWVAPDDPLKPLPLEIFMRDYYEPRLLARLLAGEQMKPVRSLAALNRAQPAVRISHVEQRRERPELARVTVEVAGGLKESGRGAREAGGETGVYDLRLFRDGQLVAYAPERDGEVRVDAQTGKASLTFDGVALPRGASAVEFSAYAFNEDRVKSATDRRTLRLAAPLPAAKGRAYVVSVGVNAYENEAWDLRFAANDARRLQDVVAERVAHTGEYEEVVRVPLISDYELRGGRKSAPRVVTEASATKANFKAVLDLLAGRPADPAALKSIPNAARLRAASPEDLVLISFSSHGYADERGTFHLLTSDTGARRRVRDALSRAVSSDELSAWLREVDAGELVLVVDACHAAASVAAAGFKPGPMGSRGLGQLSYDKGMRVLTSTQADDVALESRLIEQGFLTYALTRDGIETNRADFRPLDRRITVAEWLAYGVERVPALHAEVARQLSEMRGGGGASLGGDTQAKVVTFAARAGRSARRAPAAGDAKGLDIVVDAARLQQPALFDFSRRRAAILAKTQ